MPVVQRAGALVTSLRGRLLLFVLVSAIPLIGLALYSYIDRRERASIQAQDEALRLARVAAGDQQRAIDEARLLLSMVVALPELRTGDVTACNTMMVRLRDELGSFQSLGLIDMQGIIVCSALPEALGLSVGDRTYVQRALATGAFAVGDYQIGRASHTANVNFGYPVYDDNEHVVGVAYASLNLNWLNRYAAEAQLPPDSTLTVFDSSGTILARHPEPQSWVGESASGSRLISDLLARTGEETAEGADVDGVARIFAFVPLNGQSEGARASLIVGIPAATAYANADRDLSRDLAVLSAIGLVMLGLAWYGAERLILRPVAVLVAATRRLSAGDLGARTGLPAEPGEIGQLARAFDEMAEELQEAAACREQEEQLRRENDELEQQNRAIQEANRLKSEFVAMVSHEMGTPLTSIQGYVYLLLEGESGDLLEEQRQFLTIVYDNTGQLLALIRDLLDFSRIEAGRLELQLVEVDLGKAIRGVADTFRPMVDARGQSIALDLPDDLPAVWADRERAIQIVSNLVSNAHKYTPEGGHIWISARATEGAVEVAVRDDGLGLSEEEQAQLFSRYFRARSAVAQRTRGTGLGLPITQQLVEIQGGRIRVESAPGQGSTFSFTLPLAPGGTARPAPPEQLSARR